MAGMESEPRDTGTARRLLYAILAKSLAEMLFLCAAVSMAAFAFFHPALRGDIETADPTRVEGWVYDSSKRGEQPVVQLYVDDQFVAATRTDAPASGAGAGRHGFQFALAPKQFGPGRHRAQVYVVRKTPRGSRTLLPVSREKRIIEVTK